MKKVKYVLLKFIMPFLVIVVFFIPFICLKVQKENNFNYYDIYLSPLKCLLSMNKYGVLSITFLLINLMYFIFCVIKDNAYVINFRKITLALSIIIYIFTFKFTTNSNLNLFSVFINLFIVLIYICNCIKEIFYYELDSTVIN